uniref:THO complex subunit 3 n=1 Tax=Panagrolaimus sp. PS1159 TaxID=55785 RepID=A0AC35GHQ1_9BILA
MGIKESNKLSVDASFKTPQSCRDFFKTKSRARLTPVEDVSYVRYLVWNCDGTSLLSGSDKFVSTFSFDNSSKVRFRSNLAGHEDNVDGVAAAKTNPSLFASCSADKTIRTWDARSTRYASKTIRTWDARSTRYASKVTTKDANLYLSYTPDDNYIIFADKGDSVGLLDLRANAVLDTVAFKEETNEIVVHPNGKYAFVGMSGGKVDIINLPNLTHVKTIKAHPYLSSCQSLSLSPDQKYLAVGASDACCSIWDLEEMICVRTLQRIDYPVRSVSYSHCGNLLAMGSEDHFIDVAWAS